MEKKQPEEQSVGQPLRVMTLMDCVPGNRHTPDGPPIAILTLAHLDQIEKPMMLTIEDIGRLLIKCLECLATHKDDFAQYLIEEYLTERPKDQSTRGEDDDDPDDAGEEWKRA